MYRILVVDDEHNIADSIYYLLMRQTQWETDVLRAYDGEAALALLLRFKIDLIISDICMPGMDGLELSHKARASWPQCQIIFLTGYRNFEHAYEALQLSHVHYLLKTSDYTKLLELVERSLASVAEQRAQFAEQTLLEAHVNMAFSMLRNDLCIQLFRGQVPAKALMDELSFDIDLGQDVLMLSCQMPSGVVPGQALTDHAVKLVIYFMHRLLMGRAVHWFYCEWEGALIVLLQPYAQDATPATEEAFRVIQSLVWESLSDIQGMIEQQTGHVPTLMQSRDPIPCTSLPGLLGDIRRFAQQASSQGAILKIAAQQALLDTQGAVRHGVQYVYRHYAEDINLLALADSVHMNASYFSRLFKRETGKTFVDFLNGVRIEAACRLLRDTYMKASEIAVATGFGTPKYFHVVFKRYMNVTPIQWREQQRKD